MTTVLTTTRETQAAARASSSELWLNASEAEAATGWTMKPEGFCKGDLCVPIPPGRETEFVHNDEINAAALWALMGKPVATSPTGDVWFLGEDAQTRNEALLSLEAPDFTLPDFNGKLHSLTDFRRQRILLITWASW